MSTDLSVFGGDVDKEAEFLKNVDEIPFGNSAYQTTNLVLNHAEQSRVYRQTLLEMWEKYKALKEAQFRRRRHYINRKKKLKEIEDTKEDLDKELLEIDVEEMDHRIIVEDKLIKDAIVELNLLNSVYEKLPKLKRDEFEAAEPEYNKKRALMQAERDVITSGVVSVGNLEYLQKLGINPYIIQAELQQIRATEEQKILNIGVDKQGVETVVQ